MMKQTEKNVLVFDADKGWGIINPHAGGAMERRLLKTAVITVLL